MAPDPTALGAYLQARRVLRTPESAGLPGGGRRRTPGLRREELAALAGVSVNYLVRLEQGRHREPSAEVLAALARALGLNAQGRRHLFWLAGRPDPGPRIAAAREVSEPLRHLIERVAPSPAWILNRRRDILFWNTGAVALLGDLADLPDAERNQLHLTFRSPAARALWADWHLVAQDTVAQLRPILAGVPAGDDIEAMIADLVADDPDFAALWARHDVARACNPVRAVHHPEAGDLVFEAELLDAGDGDLQVVLLDPSDASSRGRWAAYVAGRGDGRLRSVARS
ncbi:MAG: helix-turn-helix transcriptional regulator [Solirubrobacteraceae bacterium]|nr:helix-turn-helix transcriptional regulator [Solirubrobacteraceae bacterium]